MIKVSWYIDFFHHRGDFTIRGVHYRRFQCILIRGVSSFQRCTRKKQFFWKEC